MESYRLLKLPYFFSTLWIRGEILTITTRYTRRARKQTATDYFYDSRLLKYQRDLARQSKRWTAVEFFRKMETFDLRVWQTVLEKSSGSWKGKSLIRFPLEFTRWGNKGREWKQESLPSSGRKCEILGSSMRRFASFPKKSSNFVLRFESELFFIKTFTVPTCLLFLPPFSTRIKKI